MLRRDARAWFEKSGVWIFGRYRFVSGDIEAARTLDRAAFHRLQARQRHAPVTVLVDEASRRAWWWFQDEFYWEDEALSTDEVKALALERRHAKERRLRRAVALMAWDEGAPPSLLRQAIPEDVQVFVWNRDGGRCVRCGSRELLEFDHVIPLSLGGSNTARNLQVLCQACNRAKGAVVG